MDIPDNLDPLDLDEHRPAAETGPPAGIMSDALHTHPDMFKNAAQDQVDAYGGLFLNFNFEKQPTPGHVKVELRDIEGLPDGIYYLKEEVVDKIIAAENKRRSAEQSEGGIFYSEVEVPPINDENRGLTKTNSGLVVPKDSIKVYKSTSKGLKLKDEFKKLP